MAATVEMDSRRDIGGGENLLARHCSTPAGWTSALPAKLRKAADTAEFTKWLASAERKSPLADVGRGSALSWGVVGAGDSAPADELLSLAAKFAGSTGSSLKGKQRNRIADALQQWRAWAKDGEHAADWQFALAAVAAAHLMPTAAGCCENDVWWDVLDTLGRLAASDREYVGDSAESMLCGQLLAVELPLALSVLLPEIQRFADLARVDSDRLAESAEELLNGEGLPHAAFVGAMLPLVASWTRLAVMAGRAKKSPWSKFARTQYGWLVRQALRWTAPGGRMLLAGEMSGAWSADLLQAALHYGGDPSDAAAAQELLGRKPLGKHAGAAKTHDAPEPADHCEWSGAALLRTDWSSRGTTLAVDFSQPTLRLDLRIGKQQVFCGPWSVDLQIDGKGVEAGDKWEETCWFSDDDVDFLELTMKLPNGMSIERQLLLARQELFLYLADYCSGTPGGERQLTYSGRLPLASAVDFAGERETRDGLLVAGDSAWRVLPLALAEWRADPRGGELAAIDGQLAWSVERTGTAAIAPLLIDLRSKRSRKECTWRQLTVAQGLEIQPPDVAVGYRAQSGADQWMFYRSIAERANRTLLGQNTASEFFAACFDPDTGLAEELVEIEG